MSKTQSLGQSEVTLRLSSYAEAVHQQHAVLIEVAAVSSGDGANTLHLTFNSGHQGICGAFAAGEGRAYLLIQVAADVPAGRYPTCVTGTTQSSEDTAQLTLFVLNNPPRSRVDLDLGLTPEIDLII